MCTIVLQLFLMAALFKHCDECVCTSVCCVSVFVHVCMHVTYQLLIKYSWDPELRLTPAEALNHEWILEVCVCVFMRMCVSLSVCLCLCSCVCLCIYMCFCVYTLLCHNLCVGSSRQASSYVAHITVTQLPHHVPTLIIIVTHQLHTEKRLHIKGEIFRHKRTEITANWFVILLF